MTPDRAYQFFPNPAKINLSAPKEPSRLVHVLYNPDSAINFFEDPVSKKHQSKEKEDHRSRRNLFMSYLKSNYLQNNSALAGIALCEVRVSFKTEAQAYKCTYEAIYQSQDQLQRPETRLYNAIPAEYHDPEEEGKLLPPGKSSQEGKSNNEHNLRDYPPPFRAYYNIDESNRGHNGTAFIGPSCRAFDISYLKTLGEGRGILVKDYLTTIPTHLFIIYFPYFNGSKGTHLNPKGWVATVIPEISRIQKQYPNHELLLQLDANLVYSSEDFDPSLTNDLYKPRSAEERWRKFNVWGIDSES